MVSIFRNLPRNSVKTLININNKTSRSYSSLWEPDYLHLGKPETPMYPELNVRIRSYSFPILEKYQGHIHKLAECLDIDVTDSWAFPLKSTLIKLYKENTTAIESEYHLKMYERNTQFSNVSTKTMPIFIRLLEATLPEGVNLYISEFDPAKEEKRYVPDKQLLDLRQEIAKLDENK